MALCVPGHVGLTLVASGLRQARDVRPAHSAEDRQPRLPDVLPGPL